MIIGFNTAGQDIIYRYNWEYHTETVRTKRLQKTAKECEVRKRPQKNVVYPGFPVLLRTSRSFAVFSFDLRQCVKYLSLICTGQMDWYDCFFETKNDALSMVWQRVSKIICTSNVYYRYILFLEHNSVLYRIYGFLSTQNRAYSGLSTYQVVGDLKLPVYLLSSAYRHVKLHQGADMYPDGGTPYQVSVPVGLWWCNVVQRQYDVSKECLS